MCYFFLTKDGQKGREKLFLLGGGEEAEVDGAIDAELLETGVDGEVVLLAML